MKSHNIIEHLYKPYAPTPSAVNCILGGKVLGIRKLMDMASANIHGGETTMDQSEIDDLLNL